METGERDAYGRPVIRKIDNAIELASARLQIDEPGKQVRPEKALNSIQ
ncbi:MAG: hypothetical protein R2758_16500 [Bacteroidales bacterium]